jgi:SSS family solute:Na+ symporter
LTRLISARALASPNSYVLVITSYDFAIIGCYLFIMLAIGVIFRRLSKDTSDYFRCGGVMPWWITGTSAWIASFSAWTFTGAAGKVYETGTLVLALYWGGMIGLFILWAYTCKRFRRMRVVTYVEAVRVRYGPATEQFYTWTKVPLLLFLSGVGLNAIGVFMAAVFHIDIILVLAGLGIVVTIVAFAGGAWAVLASDFVQMMLVVTIACVAAFLALAQPAIGGLSGLLAKVPTAYFNWSELARGPLIAGWVLAMIFLGIQENNSVEKSAQGYLMVKNDRDARRMVLIPLFGFLLGPVIWFIPAMTARITHPNLAAEFPLLQQPHEAAFVAVCMDVLPKGLLGLLICAMFGATLTSTDAGLNKGVGVFVRSFYKPIIAPNCGEKKLLIVGKICTLVFGLTITAVAVVVSKFRTIGLFDFVNQLAASLTTPLALPLVFGFFHLKTPPWSAWTTVVIGLAVSLAVKAGVTAGFVQTLMAWTEPLSEREASDALFAATVGGNVVIAGGWFFFTTFFYRFSSPDHQSRIEELTERLLTPVESHGFYASEQVIYRLVGWLSVSFGAFILLLILIPNPLLGRMCFVFCGGLITLVGVVLLAVGKRQKNRGAVAIQQPATIERPP